MLLTFLIGAAQENTGGKSPLFFGVKVGGVHSTFRTDYQFKFAEHRMGYAAGGNIGYRINDLISVQVDALYVQEGASYVPSNYLYYEPDVVTNIDDISVQRLNSNVVLHTIEAPLRINLHFGTRDLNFKVFAGASYNFVFHAEAKNKLFVYDNNEDYYVELTKRVTDDITSRIKEYYIGGILGASVSFPTFGLESEIEARIKVGAMQLNNLGTLRYDNPGPNDWEAPESYLDDFSVQTFMITYGINF
jgi:hypothetical protein